MKEYWAIIRQQGGCNYTFACHINIHKLEASSIKEASNQILENYALKYQQGYHNPSSIELVEVHACINMHQELLDAKKQHIKMHLIEKEEKIKAAELLELKRLKEKYEQT